MIGRFITQQYTLLNYMRLFNAYNSRVVTDSGLVQNPTDTKQFFKNLSQQDSMVFGWLAGSGMKTRNTGMVNHVAEIYNLHGTNDAVQLTEALQPYEHVSALKNVSGDTRYMAYTNINFATDAPWTATVIVDWDGSSGTGTSSDEVLHCPDPQRWISLKNGGSFIFSIFTGGAFRATGDYDTSLLIGKRNIISFKHTSDGNVQIFVNGAYAAVITQVNLGFSFSSIMGGYLNYFPGKYYGQLIHSTDLTDSEISELALMLRDVYPDIDTVQIDAYAVAVHNLELSAVSGGSVIPKAADAADWQTGLSRWCYNSDSVANGSVYGKLYNKAARALVVASPPIGYHVATEAELTTLALLGGNALKATGTGGWITATGTNTSQFTALGGGSRNADGTFNPVKQTASFWCADSDKVLKLYDNSDVAEIVAATANEGHSIRLISNSYNLAFTENPITL